ncbi:MAG TPA: alkaline phosphatase family protein [Candidatus Dormibacteraeota bacterium]|nr:alkaline phosphatase family protein [Candidatus Dormibacteraeota bacterium]
MLLRGRRALVIAAGAAVTIGVAGQGAGHVAADAGAPNGAPAHIFYIMMENHGFSQIMGNTADAPYINQLAAANGLATGFHGVTHPSLPNYLAMLSGDDQGIYDDCKAGSSITCAPEEFVPDSGDSTDTASLTPAETAAASSTPHLFSGQNLVDQLETNGLSWKAYMQSLPSAGSTVEYAPVIGGTP